MSNWINNFFLWIFRVADEFSENRIFADSD